MISWEMRKTLNQIHQLEENTGAATAPQINVYKDRTTLYRALNRLQTLDMIQEQTAPTTQKIEKTYTTTEFGKKFLNKTRKLVE